VFESLTERLGRTLQNLRGAGRLSEDNIQDALREVRRALLAADVALPVVTRFLENVRGRAIGQEVMQGLRPGEALIKVVLEELTAILGGDDADLNLNVRPPAVILLAGLQGSGKTTSAAKLARYLLDPQSKQDRKSVMTVSCDVYRPAAIAQLERLSAEVGAQFFASTESQKPAGIAAAALDAARKQHIDVLIVDTAGRTTVDQAMMAEVSALHRQLEPAETLFVVDAMTGQVAAETARAFDDALALTGVILTKTDGDARGGAALSIREVTGKPIKFMGEGEKTDAFMLFHPERIASRILGMGDIQTLIEDVTKKVDVAKAEKLAAKVKKGKGFDLEDLREQIQQMRNMGGMASMLDKLPGMANMPQQMRDQVNDKELGRTEAIINSMTPHERRRPAIIKGSRLKRIAAGSGTKVQEVNKVLKQVANMQKMMKRMKKRGGLSQMMDAMKGAGGMGGPGGPRGPHGPGGMPFG
jgi:signal recognition particle subunit SRP54